MMTYSELKGDRVVKPGNEATQCHEFDQIIDVMDRLILRTGGEYQTCQKLIYTPTCQRFVRTDPIQAC